MELGDNAPYGVAAVVAAAIVGYALWPRPPAEPRHAQVSQEATQQPTERPTAAPVLTDPDDMDARGVAAVLMSLYNPAVEIDGLAFESAKCTEKSVGLDLILQCSEMTLRDIKEQAKRLPADAIATTPCAKEIETGVRGFVDGRVKYHEALVKWLKSRKGALAAPTRTKTLSEACSANEAVCQAKPFDFQFNAEWYANVGKLECTKSLFRCGAANNACTINKVASRLGLGHDQPMSDGLYVRSTGKLVR